MESQHNEPNQSTSGKTHSVGKIAMINLDPAQTHVDDYLDVDGLKIHYRTVGVGRPLLLLHGWGGSIESMYTILSEFNRDNAVYVLDLPGHGKSGLPPIPWKTGDFTNCVLKVMDLLELSAPDIIAHSFGGRIAIQIASLHPERVGKVILVNSAGVIPPRRLKYKLKVAMARIAKFVGNYGNRVGEGIRNFVYSRVASKDYMSAGPLTGTFVLVVREELTELMPRIKTPILLVWGEHDLDTPVSSAITMRDLIPGSELVILENAGHFSYIDQATQFSLLAKRFFRK